MSTDKPDEAEIAPPPEQTESARPHRRLRRGSRSGSGISASFVGNWNIEHALGQGSFGAVHHGTNFLTNECAALKMLSKTTSDPEAQDYFEKEWLMMELLAGHPNIVPLLGIVEDSKFRCLVMELGAGDLAGLVKDEGRLDPATCRRFTAQLLDGCSHIHSFDVVHNDIKLDNAIIDAAHRTVKIADFGLSRVLRNHDSCFTQYCGTLTYSAPEMVENKGYAHPVDVWALGVCVFTMIAGKFPFRNENLAALKSDMLCWSHKAHEHGLGPLAVRFLNRIFKVDQHARPSCAELLKDPWVATLEAPPTSPPRRAPTGTTTTTTTTASITTTAASQSVHQQVADAVAAVAKLQGTSESAEIASPSEATATEPSPNHAVRATMHAPPAAGPTTMHAPRGAHGGAPTDHANAGADSSVTCHPDADQHVGRATSAADEHVSMAKRRSPMPRLAGFPGGIEPMTHPVVGAFSGPLGGAQSQRKLRSLPPLQPLQPLQSEPPELGRDAPTGGMASRLSRSLLSPVLESGLNGSGGVPSPRLDLELPSKAWSGQGPGQMLPTNATLPIDPAGPAMGGSPVLERSSREREGGPAAAISRFRFDALENITLAQRRYSPIPGISQRVSITSEDSVGEAVSPLLTRRGKKKKKKQKKKLTKTVSESSIDSCSKSPLTPRRARKTVPAAPRSAPKRLSLERVEVDGGGPIDRAEPMVRSLASQQLNRNVSPALGLTSNVRLSSADNKSKGPGGKRKLRPPSKRKE